MSNRLSSVFPRPSASDADDVVWTLQTAAVQWQRGLRADAIVWVRKAADTATQLGQVGRAEELRNHAARLAEFLWTDPEEETLDDVPAVPMRLVAGSRRAAIREPDEVIEVQELEGDDLEFTETEFTETDLATPDDAVADITAEDLTYYDDDATQQAKVLPDDLDLRSDSERPSAGSGRDSYVSITPEPDEEDSDAYMSVSPEPDPSRHDSYMDVSPDTGLSSYAPRPISDRPTRPHLEKVPIGASEPWNESLENGRFQTQPSPLVTGPPRPRAASLQSLAASRPAAEPASQGPSLAELAKLLAPGSSMATSSFGADAFGANSFAPPAFAPPASATPDSAGAEAPEVEPAAEEQPPSIDGLPFESVEALADLPEEAQTELSASGHMVTLTSGQQLVLREGAALITRGTVHVTLTYSDVSAARVGAGAVVAARGSIESGPLRLIADSAQTHVVTWTEAQLTQAMRDCPWVVDDLRLLADRFQAHASAGLGPLGERLDDALRAAVYERLQVRVLSPEECVAERGKPLKGLFVVAVGELNVASEVESRIGAGEFLFPGCVIGAEPAPHDVKAGPKGGLVLFATRPVAHELMMSVPPLLEILAS